MRILLNVTQLILKQNLRHSSAKTTEIFTSFKRGTFTLPLQEARFFFPKHLFKVHRHSHFIMNTTPNPPPPVKKGPPLLQSKLFPPPPKRGKVWASQLFPIGRCSHSTLPHPTQHNELDCLAYFGEETLDSRTTRNPLADSVASFSAGSVEASSPSALKCVQNSSNWQE